MAHRNGNLKQVFMASIGGGFISLLLALLMGTTFTYTYDNATPVGTDAPSTLDDQDRNTKLAIQERENVDHFWELTGTQVSDSQTGEHRKVTFQGPIADPTTTTNKGYFYTKDVSAVVEAHWKDESGNVLVLTDAGTLNIVSADLLGTVANNTFFTAIDQAGTGTVDLIKADANDVAVLPDNSQTATNAAPTSSTGIANKKYVDDNTTMVPAITGAGTGYAGEESITFPNGLIMKTGKTATPSGNINSGNKTEVVAFDASFPTAAITAFAMPRDTNAGASIVNEISALSVSGLTIAYREDYAATQALDGFYWQAWGY